MSERELKRDSWLIIHKSGTNIAPVSMLHKRKLPKNLLTAAAKRKGKQNRKQIEDNEASFVRWHFRQGKGGKVGGLEHGKTRESKGNVLLQRAAANLNSST